jgi:hypothetical protein
MIERFLLQFMPAVDSVHDLKRTVRIEFMDAPVEPVHETAGGVGKTDAEQAVEREGGVSDPGVAIIPVPYSSNTFGKTAGRRGDDRAGRLVGQV